MKTERRYNLGMDRKVSIKTRGGYLWFRLCGPQDSVVLAWLTPARARWIARRLLEFADLAD